MASTPDLTKLFNRHQKAVLAFSGGKDSLACLHLCSPYRDKLTVVWVNTGAAFPHMAAFIRKAIEGFNFVELKSDQAGWIEQQGFPSDMVPVASSIWRACGAPDPPRTLLQPWTACCAKLRFEPLLEYLGRSSATLFIHGQRHSDGGGLTIDSGPDAKVEICKLIWEWSDDDILHYIGKHGIELPEQYADGVMDSLDCWNCTARGGDPTALNEAKLAYIARRHPDLFAEVKLRMGKVYMATKATFDEVKADTAYAWLKAGEEAETNGAAPGQVPQCGPERASSMPDLERDIQAYKAMEIELFKHHTGKWAVFHGGKLVGAFDTLDAAAKEALRRFGRGPYLIRQVVIFSPDNASALQGGTKYAHN